MRSKLITTLGLGMTTAALLLAGCILSGTFVVVENFSFTAQNGFYFKAVDLTEQSEWNDHKDQIDLIDAVGFEMTLDNSNAVAVTFNAYIAPTAATQQYTTKSELDASAYVVIEDLTVAVGTNKVSYAESLKHIKNLAKLKELVKGGSFHYYGTATGGQPDLFTVDPGKIVITFTASE